MREHARSATCCWPTSEPASARARNERAPRRLYHISMAKSSIFFPQNLEKLLDFSQNPITGSELKITCKVACFARTFLALVACFARLELTHKGHFDILLSWLGYTSHSKKAHKAFLTGLATPLLRKSI